MIQLISQSGNTWKIEKGCESCRKISAIATYEGSERAYPETHTLDKSGNGEKVLTSSVLNIIFYVRVIGKTVRIRRGPAAVTGDECRIDATVRMDGKARQVE